MKQLLVSLIFSLSTTILCYGQRSMDSEKEVHWYPTNFKKYGITKTKEYSYKLKRNGKVKDSTLIYSQQYDSLRNRIFGMDYYHIFRSHGPFTMVFYNYERIYNQDEKLIRKTQQSIDSKNKKQYGVIESRYDNRETLSEYDGNGNLIKEIQNEIFTSKDTLAYSIGVEPTITEFIYENNKLIAQYSTRDSTTTTYTYSYFKDKEIEESKKCYSCYPKYKNVEYIYRGNGLLKQSISYTRRGEIHTKKYFYYDEKQRITKEIDSTGWFHTTIKPYLELITTYKYNESGKTVTKVRIADEFSSSTNTIEKYDIEDRVIESCYISKDYKSCITYTYENEKLKKVVYSDGGIECITQFRYNKQGLLIEEKKIYDDKTNSLTRYYYE